MSIEVLLTASQSSKQRSVVPHTSVNNKQYEKAKMAEVSFKTFYESFSFVLNFLTKIGVSSEFKHPKLKISEAATDRCHGK